MPRRPVPRLIVRIIDEHRRRATRLGDALDPRLFDAYPAGSGEHADRVLNGTDLILVYDAPGAIDTLDRAMLKALNFVPFVHTASRMTPGKSCQPCVEGQSTISCSQPM